MTMYELMTLQQLPPRGMDAFEFDWDIKNGVRPSFITDKVTAILTNIIAA